MNPSRVDFIIDLAYGVLLFLAIVLIVTAGTGIGIAFGLGALVAYIIHVGWKMARFDPEWMSKEVTENIEETLTEEVTETVGEKVTEEVTESVEETVTEEVTEEVTESVEENVTQEVSENVERALSEEIGTIIDQLEEVNERIDRRPRKDEIGEQVGGRANRRGDENRNAASNRNDTE